VQRTIAIDSARVRAKLKAIINLLLRNEKLLGDTNVKEWLRIINLFALAYCDSFTKNFFESFYSELFK